MNKAIARFLFSTITLAAAPVHAFHDLPYNAAQITPCFDPEVWEIISSFPIKDQDRITRLIGEVDLSSFEEVFPAMRAYPVARFLRITASFCFPEEGCLSRYHSVINFRKGAAAYYNSILLQKISFDALIKRHVTFDEVGYMMIWDPWIFVDHQN